jgi:ABC-2 type transport system permease protein
MKVLFGTGFWSLVRREITRFVTVFNQTILPPIISSFLYIFIFGFSIGSHLESIRGFSYLHYLVPGLMMMYVIEGSYVNTSSSLFISRWANYIEELLVTPLSYIEMVLAMLIGGMARVSMIALGVWGVSLIFVRAIPAHPFVMLFFLVFVSLTFSSLGMIVALFAEEFEHLSIASIFVITPLIFMGGVFNSVAMMPETLRWIAYFNPIFYMINGLRYGMLGISDAPVGASVAVVLSFFVILFSLTVHLFRIGFKLRK